MADEFLPKQRLRAATEQDVETALAACSDGGDLALVDAADLLEFFNRMLDVLLGDGGPKAV